MSFTESAWIDGLVSIMPLALFVDNRWLQEGISVSLELKFYSLSFVQSAMMTVTDGGYGDRATK